MIARSSLPTSRTSSVAPKRFGKFGASTATARSLRPLGWLGEGLISGVAAAALSQAARFCAECGTPADGADRARRMRRDLVAGVVRVRR
jgi:hypothetical protein